MGKSKETPKQRRARYLRNREKEAAHRKKWYEQNSVRDLARRATYGRTPLGRCQYIVNKSGCSLDDATRCRSSRCIICNVPPWTLGRYHLGPMQVGHLVPGDASGGFEPMCKKCNRYLGARTLTAETGREVLRKARRYWSRSQMRDEAWQHKDVDERGYGFGGVNESPGRQRKLNVYVEEQRERRSDRERQSRCTDSDSAGLPAVGENGSVVLPNTAQERNPED